MKDFEKEIASLLTEQAPLITQRDNLTAQIVNIGKEIEKLREELELAQIRQPMKPEEEIEYFLFEDGLVSGERYKAREKFWNDKGLWHSGYYPETSQIRLEVMLYKGVNDNLEKVFTTLEKVLPYIKVHNGVKQLGVFEHSLSENGSYAIEITDESFDLVVHRYGRKSAVKSFDNLLSLLQYVQKHHYYESSEDEDWHE
jgi:hypothetical protein